MEKILKKLKEEQKLCALFQDKDDLDCCSVGYILEVQDGYCIIESLDDDGTFRCFEFNEVESIFQVKTDSRYIQSIQKMMQIKGYQRQKADFFKGENIFFQSLNYLKQNKIIASLELHNSYRMDITGYITDFDEDVVSMQNVNDYGEFNGNAYVDLKSVSGLTFGSVFENTIDSLHKE